MPDLVRPMLPDDATRFHDAFTALGWDKSAALFDGYVADHAAGTRVALVAEADGEPVGYCTLLWSSRYPPFREAGIPELVDLNVLPRFRRRGLASLLLDALEARASELGDRIGLGVGLYADYGPAQRLYVARGYLPDGRGIVYDGHPVDPGTSIPIDDDACLMFTRRLPHRR